MKIALACAALAGCTPGTSGPMVPLPGPGITIGKDSDGQPVAGVATGQLSLSVGGRWSDRAAQSLTLVYRNNGRAPVTLTVSGISLRRGAAQAPLSAVTDVTAAAGPDYDPDTQSIPLFSRAGGIARALTIAPGETRTIGADFDALPAGPPFEAGQRLAVQVPLPGRTATIAMATQDDGWL